MKSDLQFSRTFTMGDQAAFANFSGDNNPLHMDPITARRSQAGAPVVHGMHIVLWSLESLLSSDFRPSMVRAIHGRFQSPLLVHEQATLRLQNRNEQDISARVTVAEATQSKIDFVHNASLEFSACLLYTSP